VRERRFVLLFVCNARLISNLDGAIDGGRWSYIYEIIGGTLKWNL
jgi:hypothetical protein